MAQGFDIESELEMLIGQIDARSLNIKMTSFGAVISAEYLGSNFTVLIEGDTDSSDPAEDANISLAVRCVSTDAHKAFGEIEEFPISAILPDGTRLDPEIVPTRGSSVYMGFTGITLSILPDVRFEVSAAS